MSILIYPIPLADFADRLRIESIVLDLMEAVEALTLGSGEVLTAQHGTRLWRGTVTLGTFLREDAETAGALIRAAQAPAASVLIPAWQSPRTDLTGATLHGVQNGDELRLAGLPVSTVIPRGAYLSFAYGSNPTRQAFHQVVTGMTMGATFTSYGQVVPPIRPGYTLGSAVQANVPRLKAKIVPGSVRAASHRWITSTGASFDFVQTLR